jgi:hypothetical protein
MARTAQRKPRTTKAKPVTGTKTGPPAPTVNNPTTWDQTAFMRTDPTTGASVAPDWQRDGYGDWQNMSAPGAKMPAVSDAYGQTPTPAPTAKEQKGGKSKGSGGGGKHDNNPKTGGNANPRGSKSGGSGGAGTHDNNPKTGNYKPGDRNVKNAPVIDNSRSPYYEADTSTTGSQTVRARLLTGSAQFGASAAGSSSTAEKDTGTGHNHNNNKNKTPRGKNVQHAGKHDHNPNTGKTNKKNPGKMNKGKRG